MHSHNAAHSADGSLLFFIVDGNIYDYNGDFIDDVSGPGSITMTGSTECIILPVPNECNKWMIISAVVEDAITASNATVFYRVIEYANQTYNISSNSVQINLPFIVSVGSYNAVHLALSEIRSDDSRLLFIHFGGLVYKYLIDGSTINQSTLTYFPVPPESFLTQLRSEMELIKLADETYKLAFPYLYNFSKYHIKVMHFDNTGGNLLNEVDFAMQGSAYGTNADIPKGLEFSPNGQYLYFTHTTNSNPIQYIDLSSNTIIPITVNWHRLQIIANRTCLWH
jgi:DNA-binding beta-propeller fold protein YncE